MTNRRQYLVGAGTAAATLLGIGASSAVAQNTAPKGIYFTDVNAEGEYLVLENRGQSTVDLREYYIDFEHNGNIDQTRRFGTDATVSAGADLTFEPGERLVVATGAENVPEAHVTFGYEGPVINNETPDSFALLMPDKETVVAEADKNPSPPPADTSTPESGAESTTTEADTPTATDTTTTEADADTTTTTEANTQTTTGTNTATSAPENGTGTATTAKPTETATAKPTDATTETPSGVDAGDDC